MFPGMAYGRPTQRAFFNQFSEPPLPGATHHRSPQIDESHGEFAPFLSKPVRKIRERILIEGTNIQLYFK